MQEKKCKNCLCFDKSKNLCNVNILLDEKKLKLPVFAEDNCHYLELGIPIQQIRMWEEEQADQTKKVKIEYPSDFFGQVDKLA